MLSRQDSALGPVEISRKELAKQSVASRVIRNQNRSTFVSTGVVLGALLCCVLTGCAIVASRPTRVAHVGYTTELTDQAGNVVQTGSFETSINLASLPTSGDFNAYNRMKSVLIPAPMTPLSSAGATKSIAVAEWTWSSPTRMTLTGTDGTKVLLNNNRVAVSGAATGLVTFSQDAATGNLTVAKSGDAKYVDFSAAFGHCTQADCPFASCVATTTAIHLREVTCGGSATLWAWPQGVELSPPSVPAPSDTARRALQTEAQPVEQQLSCPAPIIDFDCGTVDACDKCEPACGSADPSTDLGAALLSSCLCAASMCAPGCGDPDASLRLKASCRCSLCGEGAAADECVAPSYQPPGALCPGYTAGSNAVQTVSACTAIDTQCDAAFYAASTWVPDQNVMVSPAYTTTVMTCSGCCQGQPCYGTEYFAATYQTEPAHWVHPVAAFNAKVDCITALWDQYDSCLVQHSADVVVGVGGGSPKSAAIPAPSAMVMTGTLKQ
jgi:hypothetical protein